MFVQTLSQWSARNRVVVSGAVKVGGSYWFARIGKDRVFVADSKTCIKGLKENLSRISKEYNLEIVS